MKTGKKFILSTFFIMFTLSNAFALSNAAPRDISGSFEREYFIMKATGKYREALTLLKKWIKEVDDPVLIETNLFRMNELIVFPELIDDGIGAIESFLEHPLVKKNRFIASRAIHFLNFLYLRKGRIAEAGDILNKSGFLNFHILGPFSCSSIDEFEKSNPSSEGMEKSRLYSGRYHDTGWISGPMDRRGISNITDLNPDTVNSFFYFHTELTVTEENDYYLILGKTGYIDFSLNGKLIFKSRDRHDFSHDQYYLKVRLAAGTHKLLIKAADADGSIKLSLRATGREGETLTKPGGNNSKPGSEGRLLDASLFPSLNYLIKKETPAEKESFMAGYLLFVSGLSTDDNGAMNRYFSSISRKSLYFSWANFYAGKSEKSLEKKDRYFREADESGSSGMEPLMELIHMKLSSGFYADAYEMISRLNELSRHSIIHSWFMAKFFYHKKWNHEAVKTAGNLLLTEFPSLGHSLLYKMYLEEMKYDLALKSMKALEDMDRYNKTLSMEISDTFIKSGYYDKSISTLSGLTYVFKDDVELILSLARTAELTGPPEAALPYLSAAIKSSPYNKNILRKMGEIYYRINRPGLAVYYLRQASSLDPDNYQLKKFLSVISGEINETGDYLYNGTIAGLLSSAEKYRNEQAVILLSETAARVSLDGSSEKWIRKIVLINDESAIKDFNTQYIIVDPDVETVENVRCIVIHDGSRINSTGRYRKSLSDPESRLYYDLEAIVIPVISLRKGSILDLSYTVKNRNRKEYRDYFGEKIMLGGEYRTILTNIVVSCQEGKKLINYNKNIDGRSIEIFKKNGKVIWKINVQNLHPRKKEESMPHYSDILPAVYFTTHINWDECHAWYRHLLKNRIHASGEMKKILKVILAPNDTDIEKVRKIYYHVTGNIRYVGFELGIGGIQPREAALTYASRMGDCKDISLVLIALLREAGIDAGLALLRTSDRGAANLSIPFIGEFNHAVCFVKINSMASGTIDLFLDGTVTDSGFREIPDSITGVTALVLSDDRYFFKNIESPMYLPNSQKAFTRVTLDRDGNASLERRLIFSGSSAAEARAELKNSEKKIMVLNEYWNRRYPGAAISGLKIESINPDMPVSYSYTVNIPSLAQAGGDEMIMRSFLIPTENYTNLSFVKNRLSSILLPSKIQVCETVEYFIPDGFRVFSIPESREFKNSKFSAGFTFIKEKKLIRAASVINIIHRDINADEYIHFREFTKTITGKELERIILLRD